MVSNQVISKFPKASGDRVSNPKPNKGKVTSSQIVKPTCGNCGKKHYGDCLKGTDNCFGCGKSGHNLSNFHNVRGYDKVVVKLKQVVKMRLQIRTASMFSTLGVSKRLLLTWSPVC